MMRAPVSPWLLGAAAALSLGGAALGPHALRVPLLAVAGGATTLVAARRRAVASPPRIQLLSRLSITPRAHAALLDVDGSGWLVIVGEGCAQLARTELTHPGEAP